MKKSLFFIPFTIILLFIIIQGAPTHNEQCDSSNYATDSVLSNLKAAFATSNSCDDFGSFIRSGWNQARPKPLAYNVIETFFSQFTKALEEEESEKDEISVKAVKKIFKRCLRSEYYHLETWEEISDYLKSLGSSPFVSGSLWEPEKFSFKNVFEKEPQLALKVFFNRELQTCTDPDNADRKLVCFRDVGHDIFGLHNYKSFLNEIFSLVELEDRPEKQRIDETDNRLNDLDTQKVSEY